MSIRIRDLLARVMIYRPDLREKCEETGMWALQESVRNVCRTTGLCVVDLGVMKLTANTHKYKLNMPLHEISMLKNIAVADLPGTQVYPTKYMGEFSAYDGVGTSATVADGTANTLNTNEFMICNVAGVLDVDNVPNTTWEVGDIVLSDGTNWHQYKADEFISVGVTSKRSMDHWKSHNQAKRGLPISVSQEGNDLYFYPPSTYDTAMKVSCSVVPNLINWNSMTPIAIPVESATVPQPIDMIELPLPVEAENAILYGALEIIFRIPKPDGTLDKIHYAQAEKYGKMHLMEMSGLRAMALLGSSGAAWYVPSNFTGRSNVFSTSRSSRRRV